MRGSSGFIARALVAGTVGFAAPGSAQHAPLPDNWTAPVALAAMNVLAGGVTAATTAWLRGEAVGKGFLKGCAGGAVVFAGKRLAAERFDGAGLLGRQIGGIGGSMVANGGAGRGWLDEAWASLGPLWLQVSPASPIRLRVDAASVVLIGWAATRDELELDLAGSLADGVALFRAPRHGLVGDDGRRANGMALPGLVILGVSDDPDAVRAHERVHIVQYDFVLLGLGRPIETWAWSRIFGGNLPLDLGLGALPMRLPGLNDMAEGEAEMLEP